MGKCRDAPRSTPKAGTHAVPTANVGIIGVGTEDYVHAFVAAFAAEPICTGLTVNTGTDKESVYGLNLDLEEGQLFLVKGWHNPDWQTIAVDSYADAARKVCTIVKGGTIQ